MTRHTLLGGLVLALLFTAVPTLALAGDGDDSGVRVWMASSDRTGATHTGTSWGRLVLQDGRLTFFSMRGLKNWEIDLADAHRVEMSLTGAKTFEVETLAGDVFYVAILDRQMTVDSPRKALKSISHEVEGAATEARRLAAAATRDAQPTGSAKVVRVDGGQSR